MISTAIITTDFIIAIHKFLQSQQNAIKLTRAVIQPKQIEKQSLSSRVLSLAVSIYNNITKCINFTLPLYAMISV